MLEIARLGFSLVLHGLFWFGLFPFLKKKMAGKITSGKKQ